MDHNPEHNYIIGGVKITFPCKAYPSQLSMMDKIVKSLVKKQNCLLESPTGSGKSLALLCSCLAWQKKAKQEMDELTCKLENNVVINTIEKNESKLNPKVKSNEKDIQSSEISFTDNVQTGAKEAVKKFKSELFTVEEHQCIDDKKRVSEQPNIIDSDFMPTKKYRITNSPRHCGSNSLSKRKSLDSAFNPSDIDNHVRSTFPTSDISFTSKPFPDAENVMKNETAATFPDETTSITLPANNKVPVSTSPFFLSESSPTVNWLSDAFATGTNGQNSVFKDCDTNNCTEIGKAPKIYFGTRTHKQITQIVRELKKTCYKDVKMTILSSRERTCIHKHVSRMENKNEGCEELRKSQNGPGCSYFHKAQKVHHYNPPALSSAWDLEDLVTSCEIIHACPYYSSKNLLKTSDIVFCPYNYLIDPLIRSCMEINLKNSIVIMDEAHNIEDSAREAASFSMSQTDILEAMNDLETVALNQEEFSDSYFSIREILSGLSTWLSKNSISLSEYNSFEKSGKVWAGEEMVAILDFVGTGPDKFPNFKENLKCIINIEADDENGNPTLNSKTLTLLKGLLMTLDFLYRNKLMYIPDYRCVIEKVAMKQQYNSQFRRKSISSSTWDLKLNFWCLNPAVSFSDFRESVHSLIVASGTLYPFETFESELGMPFKIRLEANHVIPKSQMWVGTIRQGPKGLALNATFRNAETFSFQDDVGMLVLRVCTVVPHGVLCFLPSYSMLDKLTTRWQMTGLWNEILCKKLIVCEPRGKNQNFERVMHEFYESIKITAAGDSGINGALFIAVFRGKVSEGLDFADNNARAVITIGIPFPNIKDIQVDLKKKYNDMHSLKRPIMSGRQWYETQAFRALNQALGRCIRHRNDFGALLIVDERFQMYPRYVGSLSKWIRKEVIHYSTFTEAERSLEDFVIRTGLVQQRVNISEEQ